MKTKSLLLTFLLLLSMLSTAWADEIITIVADGQTISDATTWTDCTVNITGNGTVTFSKRITISGDVTLNLGAGATLKATIGITVSEGNSLTIAGDGSLTAGAYGGDYHSAAIGGTRNQNSGTINITGGTINATGWGGGAGIGGGDEGSATIINISGGNVTATGSNWSAGIGGGYKGSAGTITITGGVVNATGHYKGAGIGGGGDSDNPGGGGTITISGGQVTATGGKDGSNPCGYGIGPGKDGTLGTISLSWTESTDFINASSYKGTISFEDSKRFYYDGTTDFVTADELANKLNQKIVPAVANNNSLEFADIQMPRYYITTNGTAVDVKYDVYDYDGNKLMLGTHYTAVIKNSGNEDVTTLDQLGDYTLTVTGTGTTYTGSKSFTFSLVEWDPNLSEDGSDHSINFPADGTKKTVYLGKDQTIKVYDSEGKDGNLVVSDGRLMLYAPEGYALEVTGRTDAQFYTAGLYYAWLKAYNGNEETEGTLITKIEQNSEAISFASGGNGMLMRFNAQQVGSNKYGLDLTVTVVQAESHTITKGTCTNGDITIDKTSANTNETVTLTVNPASGYLLKRITITDTDNSTTLSTIGEDQWYSGSNTLTFKMPNKNITLTPEFTNDLTADGLPTLNMPLSGEETFIIPDGVKSFNISGSPLGLGITDAYASTSTTAIIQASNGYRLQATGNVEFYNTGYDYGKLNIYDGANASATPLTNIKGMNQDEISIGTQTSSSNYMTIYLYENGLYDVKFTGKINMVYSITYDLAGGSVAMENPTTYTIESDAITLNNPTKDGYTFAGWTGTGLDDATETVTIAQGLTGDRSYTATWKKNLSHTDITVADIPDQAYAGLAICPEVIVTDGETALTLGTDYTVSYSANINVGTATATITGIGDYSGTVEKEFAITKATLTVTAKNKTIAYGDEPANDGVEYSSFLGSDDASVLGGTLTYGYNYEKGNKTGEYVITPSGLTADNYEINFVSGTLIVETKKTTFAAIQVFEDENGKRAEINGEYKGEGTVNIPKDIENVSVEFNRTFTVDKYSTIVLPFGIAAGSVEGAVFYKIDDIDVKIVGNDTIWGPVHIAKVTDNIEANTPYLLQPTATKLTFKDPVTLNTSEKHPYGFTKAGVQWEFRGTYHYFDFGNDSTQLVGKSYGFVAKDQADGLKVGQFRWTSSKSYILPMRGYLVYRSVENDDENANGGNSQKNAPMPQYVLQSFSTPSVSSIPEILDVKVVDKDGGTTVIGKINTRTGEIRLNSRMADRWFDLQGRVLNGKPGVKGRYLHNGKIEIVK